MSDWRDRVVVVTGGSAGFGRHLVTSFAAAGAQVVAIARNEPRLLEVCQALDGVDPLVADVTVAEQRESLVQQVIDKYGRIDALVNNAGLSTRGKVLETTADDFRQLMELNFISLAECTRLASPHLIASGGHVVNIGSLAAKGTSPFLGAYPATKFAVAAYSQQLRWELQPQGVHVLLVCPGPIRRDDAGTRYDSVSGDLPEEARKPGAGVKIKGTDPKWLADQVVRSCDRRIPELVVPFRAKILFALSQLSASWGDWLTRKMTSS